MSTYEARQAARKYLREKEQAREITRLTALIILLGCFALGILIGMII